MNPPKTFLIVLYMCWLIAPLNLTKLLFKDQLIYDIDIILYHKRLSMYIDLLFCIRLLVNICDMIYYYKYCSVYLTLKPSLCVTASTIA